MYYKVLECNKKLYEMLDEALHPLQRNNTYIVLHRNTSMTQIKRLAIKPYTKRFTAIENKINELVDLHNAKERKKK